MLWQASSVLTLDPHPLIQLRAFRTHFPRPLEQMPSPDPLKSLLSLDAPAPLKSDDDVRSAIRDLLRHGGYKPTGRGKPASEYLIRAATENQLGSINLAVDACNAVSLHSGLPISVIDLGRATAPFRVGLGKEGDTYVFNASGQTIDVAGLLCLFDAEGPCANPVKDAQRTKTHGGTTDTLTIVWGARALDGRAGEATRWYQSILREAGAQVEDVI
jgi:DNA/RNA-binding domain of Phe-tRNA-synthetase-like protein